MNDFIWVDFNSVDKNGFVDNYSCPEGVTLTEYPHNHIVIVGDDEGNRCKAHVVHWAEMISSLRVVPGTFVKGSR